MSEQFDTSWFSLEKYNGLKNIDLSEWLWQIDVRQYIENLLHDESSNLNIKFHEGWDAKLIEYLNQEAIIYIEDRFELIKDNPIIPRFYDSPPRDFDLEWRKDILS